MYKKSSRSYLDGELELVVELGDEQVVRERLTHLHDAHDGRVDLVLSVLEHALLRRLLLLALTTHNYNIIDKWFMCRYGHFWIDVWP